VNCVQSGLIDADLVSSNTDQERICRQQRLSGTESGLVRANPILRQFETCDQPQNGQSTLAHHPDELLLAIADDVIE
jgi:hypothetical protein